MKCIDGWWLPDGEEHLVPLLGDYQGDKRRAALKWVKQWRLAVDVGAHVGLWSRPLAEKFQCVVGFEPVAEHRECFERNAPSAGMYPYALGERVSSVAMAIRLGCTAHACVVEAGDIEMRMLDDFGLADVDFLKVDCVGYELAVLRGARETLERCRPCVSVEQKPGYAERFGFQTGGAVEFLIGLGAELRASHSGVHVLSWA